MRGFFYFLFLMSLSQSNCKGIFRAAYENRYTWPSGFEGYKGKCIFDNGKEKAEGDFSIGKNLKPEINNILKEDIAAAVGSQLFEVVIHRVRRNFDEIHFKNQFNFINETKDGIEMLVMGKNEGDKYRVHNQSINMVYRKMHGIVIEIFVEDFLNTGNGLLSEKYTSQQLDQNTFEPKSPKFYYLDKFEDIGNGLWTLKSRNINYLNENKQEKFTKFNFEQISPL